EGGSVLRQRRMDRERAERVILLRRLATTSGLTRKVGERRNHCRREGMRPIIPRTANDHGLAATGCRRGRRERGTTMADAQNARPNILVIFGDDIGFWNISAYNQGMMGYRTPNLDRIAREGALFTDGYGEEGCT